MAKLQWATLGFAFLLVQAQASHSDRAPGKREFNAIYVRLNTKFVHRDIKGLAAFMRADFMYEGPNGRGLRREEFLQSAFLLLSQVKSPKDVETVDSVKLSGGSATLNLHEVFTASVNGLDHRKHAYKQTDTATDTWVKTGHAWLLKKTVVHTTARFRDGMPSGPLGQFGHQMMHALPAPRISKSG